VKFQIGAMSVGDILDRGIRLLTSRLVTFYVINLIVLFPLLIAQLMMPEFGGAMPTNEQGQPVLGPEQARQAVAFLFLVILGLFLQPIGSAAILHVISQEFVDRRVGIGQAFRFAFQRFGSLLWASLLKGLVFMAGMLMCCVPFILFQVWYVFVSQVVVMEDYRGADALSRSKDLTSGFRWRIFGVMTLLFVVSVIFSLAAGVLQAFLPVTSAVRTEAQTIMVTNYPNYVVNVVVTQIVNILVRTYEAVCWTLFYFDIRIRKEGLDLELAAQQQSAKMGARDMTGFDVSGLE
jgi:hypothetical protein